MKYKWRLTFEGASFRFFLIVKLFYKNKQKGHGGEGKQVLGIIFGRGLSPRFFYRSLYVSYCYK